MATKITPLGRRVLVKRVDSEEKTAGGIYLPDTAKEKPQEAEVLALGIGKDDEGKDVAELFTVKVGNKVLISKYGGTEVKIDGEDRLIINETDVLGIVA
jgi:chaperonin GroES